MKSARDQLLFSYFRDAVLRSPTDRTRRINEIEDQALRSELERLLEEPSQPSPSSFPSDPPFDRFPGFRPVEVLKEGGQARVVLAWWYDRKTAVALRTLKSGPEATARERRQFEHELHTLAQLSHPNILRPLTDLKTADSVPFSVYQYFSPDLNIVTYLRRPPAPTYRTALSLFRTLCEAVNDAHDRGVLHCDLKPNNILVDAHGHVHVIDFGLSRPQDGRIPPGDAGNQFFSVANVFTAPELVLGTSSYPTQRTDVYSLGAIF